MPKNWKTYKLGDVSNLDTGFAFKSKSYNPEGELRVIRGKNVTEGFLRWGSDAQYWNHSIEKLEKYVVEEDDIVIGMDGSKVGKNRAIVRSVDLPVILAQRVARVREIKGVSHQKYLWQLINNSKFETYVDNIRTGTSIPHISLGQIKEFEIYLPPLPEQRAIASILSALDDKIELNLQQNQTLEEMAMALYKHWFVDFEFPSEAHAKDGYPLPYKSSGGEFVESELGMIPKGWEVKRLEELADVGSSKRIFLKEYVEEGIPFFRGKEIIQLSKGNNISTELFISNERYNEINSKFGAPSKNDILISSVGTIGVSWLVENDEAFYFKDGNLTWIKNYQDGVNGNFISQWLKSYETQQQIKSETIGSTQQALTISALKQLKVILPPKESLIVEDISQKLVIWNELLLSNKLEINSLTTLRDTLLPKLISGEVRVKDIEHLVKAAL